MFFFGFWKGKSTLFPVHFLAGPMPDYTERNREHGQRIFDELCAHACDPRGMGEQVHALCPFHDDSQPSFSLNREKGWWYCHACDIGGVVWDFLDLLKQHNLSICTDGGTKKLVRADRMRLRRRQSKNLTLKPFDVDSAEVLRCYGEIIEHWHQALTQDLSLYRLISGSYSEHFTRPIFSKGSTEEHLYVSPEFLPETVEQFKIGFAPNSNAGFVKDLRTRYSVDVIIGTGLFHRGGNNGIHTTFAGRIVYPYLQSGIPIYATARLTPLTGGNTSNGKYLKQSISHGNARLRLQNPPLFNADILRRHDTVLWAEGITDAIKASEAGIPAISAVGLHVALRHIDEVLRMLAEKTIILCYDDEENGRGADAMERMRQMLVETGCPVHCLRLPRDETQGKVDVCSFIRDEGVLAFHRLIEEQTGLTFLADNCTASPRLRAFLQDGREMTILTPDELPRAVGIVFKFERNNLSPAPHGDTK